MADGSAVEQGRVHREQRSHRQTVDGLLSGFGGNVEERDGAGASRERENELAAGDELAADLQLEVEGVEERDVCLSQGKVHATQFEAVQELIRIEKVAHLVRDALVTVRRDGSVRLQRTDMEL